jgi:hypothetical protein
VNDIVRDTLHLKYEINVYLDGDMTDDTLGLASIYTNEIWLNEKKMADLVLLNDVDYNLLSVVLIHEILHILGVVGTNVFGVRLTQGEEGVPANVYIGKHGIERYKSVLHANGLDNTHIVYLPIENNFGEGTQRTHLEEGFDDDNKVEKRYINDVYYPVPTNELMTGFINKYNYITPITLGILEDYGFTVNYDSIYVTSVGGKLIFI